MEWTSERLEQNTWIQYGATLVYFWWASDEWWAKSADIPIDMMGVCRLARLHTGLLRKSSVFAQSAMSSWVWLVEKKKKRRLKLWDQIALVGGKEGWEIRTTRESSWTERKRKRGKEWTIQKKMTNPWKRRVHDEKIRWVIKTTEIRETSARKTRRHDTEWEGKECVTEKLGKRQRGTAEPHYCSTLDQGSKPQKTPQDHINEENEAHTHDANHP